LDRTHTDAHGRFRLRTEPGAFVIRATSSRGLSGETAQKVRLSVHSTTHLRMSLDIGIRTPLGTP